MTGIELLIEFTDGEVRTIPISSTWYVNNDRKLLIIGKGIPRQEFPLCNIRRWQVQQTEVELPSQEYWAQRRREAIVDQGESEPQHRYEGLPAQPRTAPCQAMVPDPNRPGKETKCYLSESDPVHVPRELPPPGRERAAAVGERARRFFRDKVFVAPEAQGLNDLGSWASVFDGAPKYPLLDARHLNLLPHWPYRDHVEMLEPPRYNDLQAVTRPIKRSEQNF